MKTHLKSCRKQYKGTPIYRLPKTSRWGSNQQSGLLKVYRPVDRPTVRFLTVVQRSTDRSTVAWQMTQLSTARSTGPFRESRGSLGPPALGCARLCTSVDRPVDRQKASPAHNRDLKHGFLHSIKSHKFSKNL